MIQSRRVILALFLIPFPGRDPDLGLGLSNSRVDGLARSLAASLRLAVVKRCRASEPDRFSAVGCFDGRSVVAGSYSLLFLLRGSAQAVEGAATEPCWCDVCRASGRKHPPSRQSSLHVVFSSDFVCCSRPGAVFRQYRPASRFLERRDGRRLAAAATVFQVAHSSG